MKKTKLIITLSGILCAMALTGCNANVTVSEPVSGEPVSINIEVSETAGVATTTETVNTTGIAADNNSSANQVNTQQTTNSSVNTVNTQQTDNTSINQVMTNLSTNETEYGITFEEACADIEYATTDDNQDSLGGYAIDFTYITDDVNYRECAIVTGTREDGSGWEYKTSPCEIGQYCRQEWIASPGKMICINEGGYIVALNDTTGDVLWRNSEYVGGGTFSAVDENGRIYVASDDGQALVVIDNNGETIISVDQFADYTMISNMYFEGNNLIITYDCADNAAVEMDITDFSYTIQ